MWCDIFQWKYQGLLNSYYKGMQESTSNGTGKNYRRSPFIQDELDVLCLVTVTMPGSIVNMHHP